MQKLHIVITDSTSPDIAIEQGVLAPLNADVVFAHCRNEEDVLAAGRDADALLVQFAPITRKVISELTRCRIISRYGVGVDMIDLDAAKEHGIVVKYVPDYCVEEVASHTLCFLLTLSRKIFMLDRAMRKGLWNIDEIIRPVNRLVNQTLGLVGLGRIGRRVAQMAAPLGLRILGYDVKPPADHGPVSFTDFETVVRESDFLSLHCPLTAGTRHSINAEVLNKMKPTAFLINVSRGAVVDTAALVEALSRKQIAGAALDVFEQEPLPADHVLRNLENVVLTPHRAALSIQARLQMRQETAQHVVDFFQKQ